MAERIRAHDWATTPLGAIAGWPQQLGALVELMLATSQLATLAVGPARILLYNDAAARRYGRRHPDVLGRPLAEAFAHEFPRVAPFYDRVFAGESVHLPGQPPDPSDQGRPEVFEAHVTPVRDSEGRVIAAYVTGSDVGALRPLEADLREREERELHLQMLLEGIPQLVWRAVGAGCWTWASPQWTRYTGQGEPESRGSGWLEMLHPDDRKAACDAWSQAVESGRFEVECRIRRSDGAYHWFQTRAAPVRDEGGAIIEWLGASNDVQDMRALQDRQRVLLHELQHRVRNMLTVVRSIVARTGETSDSVEHFSAHLEGRLSALARTQMVLTRASGAGVDLENMIREEMLAQVARDGEIEVGGPEVRLPPKAAEVLALAVHELATNSVKYGALSAATGRVDVQWAVSPRDGLPWLSLVWEESGVRVLATAPRREGFGTELIETRATYELGGRGALAFRPGGVRCEIEFPLAPGGSILQTDASLVDAPEEA